MKARELGEAVDRAWTRVWDRVLVGFDRPFLRGLYSLLHGMSRDGVGLAASAMAFDLFLSLIPLLALAGWLLSHALAESTVSLSFVSTLLDLTPFQVQDILSRHIGRFSAGIAPLAVFGTIYIASGAFHTVMDVMEQATEASRRPWWKKRAVAVVCVLASVLLLAVSATVAVALTGGPGRVLLAIVGSDRIPNLARYTSYGVATVMATVALAGFFRVAIDQPGFRRRVWPGASLTMAIGLIASFGFTQYLQTLARFTLYYGSLATVAVTLAWLYIWCFALLVGAELNAQLENEQRRRFPHQARQSLRPPPPRP
jgi:membrane protein